jgi:ribonuclease P protein component
MKGEQYLTKPEDFVRIHGQGKWLGGGLIGIKSCPNSLPLARYGFIVSKRVGKAVVRNCVKRRLREILRQMDLKPGTDTIFSARPKAAQAEFAVLKIAVSNLLAQAGLLVRNDKKSCSADD